MYKYSPENAAIYGKLGVIGTTYEVSFNEMARVLGEISGGRVLDYGCGAGRSTQLVKTLGAKEVIGVDHDANMIEQAKRLQENGISFQLITDRIPLPDEYVDAAVCAHVWVEIKSKDEMIQSAKEMARVMKRDGILVVISTNPDSIGCEYVSYAYKKVGNPRSGDPIICILKGENSFEIDDVYWTEQDYLQILEEAGFSHINVTYPLAEGEGWLEETNVAPDIAIKAIKST